MVSAGMSGMSTPGQNASANDELVATGMVGALDSSSQLLTEGRVEACGNYIRHDQIYGS